MVFNNTKKSDKQGDIRLFHQQLVVFRIESRMRSEKEKARNTIPLIPFLFASDDCFSF